jgi:hypothetical protein
MPQNPQGFDVVFHCARAGEAGVSSGEALPPATSAKEVYVATMRSPFDVYVTIGPDAGDPSDPNADRVFVLAGTATERVCFTGDRIRWCAA